MRRLRERTEGRSCTRFQSDQSPIMARWTRKVGRNRVSRPSKTGSSENDSGRTRAQRTSINTPGERGEVERRSGLCGTDWLAQWTPAWIGATLRGVLLKTLIHERPARRTNSRLNWSCGEKNTINSPKHTSAEEERTSRVGEAEFVWNGESTLTATTEDLLYIWEITRSNSKYSNAHLIGRGEQERMDSFRKHGES
jgi:hypothetical protein